MKYSTDIQLSLYNPDCSLSHLKDRLQKGPPKGWKTNIHLWKVCSRGRALQDCTENIGEI